MAGPRTTVPSPEHKVYSYLPRYVAVTRPNQVWAADITYVPMAKRFMYLVAVIDWYSRKVLAHRVSNTMEAGFCLEALKEALARYGRLEIFNTDHGSQFTSDAFEGGQDLKNGLKSWVAWYNRQRPQQGLGCQTPNAVYDKEQEPIPLVA